MSNENKFSYTYSASEQEEIKRIREKYMPKTQAVSTLEQLRKLDKKAESKATVISLIIGIAGSLLFGTGMSCIMVWGNNLFIIGVIIGIIGMLISAGAYPAYMVIVKKEREKIAPLILKLTDEISNS